ncbi:hypothetical protein HWV62_14066 [Athelia sp. TMB]|nr:hypothetical protein HWV62_14066 [Athelia sp. TMB]
MSDIIPLRSRGTWQGLLNIIFATGSAIGAPLGGLLAGSIGWRWSFLIQVPAMMVAIVTVAFALHLPKAVAANLWTRFRRVDFLGAITLISSIFFLLLALNYAGNLAWSDRKTILALAAFAVLFPLFCIVEVAFAAEPFAPKRIIVNRSLIAAYAVNFFGVASAMTMIFQISLYYQAARGMSAVQVGLWLLPSIFAGVAGSLGGGLIMQASGKYYWLTVAGYASLLVGSIVVVLAAGVVGHSLAWLVVGQFLSSLGNGNGVTASLISLIANAGPQDQAIATAMSYLFRSLGSVVGLSIGSTLTQNALRASLHARLSGPDADVIIDHVTESLNYIDTLPVGIRAIVRTSYEEAVHSAMWFAVALAVAAAVFSFFIKETPLARAPSAPVVSNEGREET